MSRSTVLCRFDGNEVAINTSVRLFSRIIHGRDLMLAKIGAAMLLVLFPYSVVTFAVPIVIPGLTTKAGPCSSTDEACSSLSVTLYQNDVNGKYRLSYVDPSRSATGNYGLGVGDTSTPKSLPNANAKPKTGLAWNQVTDCDDIVITCD